MLLNKGENDIVTGDVQTKSLIHIKLTKSNVKNKNKKKQIKTNKYYFYIFFYYFL